MCFLFHCCRVEYKNTFCNFKYYNWLIPFCELNNKVIHTKSTYLETHWAHYWMRPLFCSSLCWLTNIFFHVSLLSYSNSWAVNHAYIILLYNLNLDNIIHLGIKIMQLFSNNSVYNYNYCINVLIILNK